MLLAGLDGKPTPSLSKQGSTTTPTKPNTRADIETQYQTERTQAATTCRTHIAVYNKMSSMEKTELSQDQGNLESQIDNLSPNGVVNTGIMRQAHTLLGQLNSVESQEKAASGDKAKFIQGQKNAMNQTVTNSYNQEEKDLKNYYLQGICAQGNRYSFSKDQVKGMSDNPFFGDQICQESSLKPTATSNAGAAGIAQFMPDTARGYGLKVGWYDKNGHFVGDTLPDPSRAANCQYFDQRISDPTTELKDAANYDDSLYSYFSNEASSKKQSISSRDCWALAMAAYNCGEQSVQDAINKAGGSCDIAKIFSNLPGQAQGYLVSIGAY